MENTNIGVHFKSVVIALEGEGAPVPEVALLLFDFGEEATLFIVYSKEQAAKLIIDFQKRNLIGADEAIIMSKAVSSLPNTAVAKMAVLRDFSAKTMFCIVSQIDRSDISSGGDKSVETVFN